MVQAGLFREDLLYRLNALTLRVPPLRERPEEIVPLARELLVQVCEEWDRSLSLFSPEALAALAAYSWPGNVRQLRNVIERALLVCRRSTIERSDLPCELSGSPGATLAVQVSTSSAAAADAAGKRTFREQVQAFEVELIRCALAHTEGNQRAASRELGIPLRTLAHKIKAFGLRTPTNDREGRANR
jgi:DNA-binding NtrC family response regulator